MTEEYRVRENEITSHLDSYLTQEMTTAERLISQIQEVMSSSPAVSRWQRIMGGGKRHTVN